MTYFIPPSAVSPECPIICPLHIDPVCGSDGRTYNNLCGLHSASECVNPCITLKGDGPCRECTSIVDIRKLVQLGKKTSTYTHTHTHTKNLRKTELSFFFGI